jgi:hypothetical protein
MTEVSAPITLAKVRDAVHRLGHSSQSILLLKLGWRNMLWCDAAGKLILDGCGFGRVGSLRERGGPANKLGRNGHDDTEYFRWFSHLCGSVW